MLYNQVVNLDYSASATADRESPGSTLGFFMSKYRLLIYKHTPYFVHANRSTDNNPHI